MKKLYTISLLVLCIVTTGCSDWLNVAPSNQVNEENLFSTGNGYRNALNGVYLDLGTSTLYGQNLSWGFMDLIAQYYSPVELNKERVYYQALNYKFEHTDVKSIISSIWSRSYNNIANCNNLINQVSNASPSLFEQGELEKNMIHGEALALRAFIHFEILRMFAPAMMKDDHKAYMPYVDVYPTFVPAYETNEEILKKVVADLKEAKRMLAQCDITEEHREWMAINPRMLGIDLSAGDIAVEDVFFAFRGYRMNYYAMTAILARVYFWNGEYELAYNEAKEVLDATYDDDGQKCFSFMEYLELGNNMKDYNSIIMCFFNKTLQEDYEPFITKSSKDVFYLADFEKGEKELDQRLLEDMIGSERSNKYSRKYDISLGTYGSDMIPGIRLSEMYYIMGEYFARTNNFIKAGEMLDEVRFNRGIITTNLKNTITTLDGYHTEMLKDMRKEFVGEGQLFFQYKRLDKKPAKNAIFVFEKPNNEDV